MIIDAKRLLCATVALGASLSIWAQTAPQPPVGYVSDPPEPKPEDLKPNPHFNPQSQPLFIAPANTGDEPIERIQLALRKGDLEAYRQALEEFKGQAVVGRVIDQATLALIFANDPLIYQDIHNLINAARNPAASQRMLMVESLNKMMPTAPNLLESIAWIRIAKGDAERKAGATDLQTAADTGLKLMGDLDELLTKHLLKSAKSKEDLEKKLTKTITDLKQQGTTYAESHERQTVPPVQDEK